MAHERSLVTRRTEIDRHLEAVLDTTERDCVASARSVIEESRDRHYGQILALSYESMPNTSDTESILPAATAIELLRGYCRLRSEQVIQHTDGAAQSANRDPKTALLTGDYLYTAAFSSLGEVDIANLDPCFDTLTMVAETMIETFYTDYTESPSPATDYCSLIDGTGGILGQGAAVIGATLADIDGARRRHFERLGRGLGTGYQIRRTLTSDAESLCPVPPVSDETQLHRHAQQHLTEAEQVLQALSSIADVDPLRALIESTG